MTCCLGIVLSCVLNRLIQLVLVLFKSYRNWNA